MTDLLEDFEAFLIAKGAVSVLYRDFLPLEPADACGAYEYSGASPIPQIAGAYRPVQFVARSTVATTAKLAARKMYNALITEDGVLNLTAQRWCTIELKQPPFKMKEDEQGNIYYCFNVGVVTYID